MMYGKNSRSMDYRERRSYKRNEYNSKINRDYNIDVRKRALPKLEIGNDSLKLRIVHSKTIIVVGVSEELSDVKVLEQDENLGRYGKILDIQIKKSFDKKKYMVSYEEEFEAGLAFKGINLLKLRGNRWNKLKAYYSKNKFCINFLKGDKCRNYKCPFIHENLKEARFFSEGEVNASYFEDLMSERIIRENLEKIKARLFGLESHFQESKFFLNVDKILIELKLAKRKDFIEKDGREEDVGEQVSRRYQSESKTIKSDIQHIDLTKKTEEMFEEKSEVEITPLQMIHDSGIEIEDISFKVGKKLILDEFLELDMLIRRKRRKEQNIITPRDETEERFQTTNLLDPEDLILRNNEFFFSKKSSKSCSPSSKVSSQSEYSDYEFQFEDFIQFDDICIRPKSWVIDSAPGEVIHRLENHLSWMKILSLDSYESLKKRVKIKKQKKKKKRKKTPLKSKEFNYLYEIGLASRKDGKSNVDDNKLKKERKESEEKENLKLKNDLLLEKKPSTKSKSRSRNLSKISKKSELLKKRKKSFNISVNKPSIENPNTRNKYFETENKFDKLMYLQNNNFENDGETSEESKVVSKKSKEKKNSANVKIVESHNVSIFAGKKARRKKKNQKRKKKKKKKQMIQEVIEVSRKAKSTTMGSMECSITQHKTETDDYVNENEKSEVSDMDVMDMIGDSGDYDKIRDSKIGNMRKKSEIVMRTDNMKKKEKDEIKKFEVADDKNSRAKSIAEEKESRKNGKVEEKNNSRNEEEEDMARKKKKKRKRKKKKKKNKEKDQEKKEINQTEKTKISKESEKEKIVVEEKKEEKKEKMINCEKFLPEDEMDQQADDIYKALNDDDKDDIEKILFVMDYVKTSHEIFFEKGESSTKLVFMNDSRSFPESLYQKLHDNSDVKH